MPSQPPPSRAPFFIAGAVVALGLGAAVYWLSLSKPTSRPETASSGGGNSVSHGAGSAAANGTGPDASGRTDATKQAANPSATGEKAPALPRPRRGPISIEDARTYFMTWGGHLIWEDNYTEFALWSPESGAFTEYFGVRFVAGEYRIEKLTHLTRPLLDHGVPVISPIALTEPAARREEFYRRNPNYQPIRLRWDEHAPLLPPSSPRPPSESPAVSAPVSDASSSSTPPRTIEPLTSTLGARTLVARLQELLRRGNLPDIDGKAADLVALLQLSGVDPVLPSIAGADLERAIDAREKALETALPSASALLDETQLAALRGLLQLDINRLKEQRRDRDGNSQILPPLDATQQIVSPTVSHSRPP